MQTDSGALTDHQPEETSTQRMTLGIVGGGTMGAGLAEVAALQGISTMIFDTQQGASQRAIDGISSRLEQRASRQRITSEEAEAAIACLHVANSIDELTEHSHAVIEAIIESIEIKQQVFFDLDRLSSPNTLLASNTSALPITAIAARAAHPERIIGMHFFAPVPAMVLCEIIRGLHTSEAILESAQHLASALGKKTIVVNRDDAGFVTSRLMTVLSQEAVRIVEAGIATPEDIDRACELGFGHKLGPLATLDVSGLDVALNAGKSIHQITGDAAYAPPQLLQRLVSAGQLGRKTGNGFFDYTAEGKK